MQYAEMTRGQRAAFSRRIMRSLRRAGGQIEANISKPNYGGCAVIAAAVGRELEKAGVPVEVVTPRWRGDVRPSVIVQKLAGKGCLNNVVASVAGLNRQHFAIRFRLGRRLMTWDSEGFYGARGFGACEWDDAPRYPCGYRFGGGMPVAAAETLADDPQGWNAAFDRSQIPEVRRIAQEAFLH